MSDKTVIRILKTDDKRIDNLKVHKTEPKWSVVERVLDEKEKGKKEK